MRMTATFADARVPADGVVGLVPTMGYLHEGHLSLIAAARAACDTVMVSLFVNPLQFGPKDDLTRYPRDLDRDAALAEEAGADILFVPSVEEMYPVPPVVTVAVGGPADDFEGAHRPGHFAGVATVVTKLFAGLQPDRAYFGAKDAQQFVIVRRLAADLSFPLDVVRVATVRDHDGLALSSRNSYLSPAERAVALSLSFGLLAAADLAEQGVTGGAELEEAAAAIIGGAGEVDLEYVALVDAGTGARLSDLDREGFLAAAVRVGTTRLIDNVWLIPSVEGFTADRGVRLEEPSSLSGR